MRKPIEVVLRILFDAYIPHMENWLPKTKQDPRHYLGSTLGMDAYCPSRVLQYLWQQNKRSRNPRVLYEGKTPSTES
jgi:hypothetical protein